MKTTYDFFAEEFDKTRYKVWRKVACFLDTIPSHSLLADVGTGNGKNALYRNDIVVMSNDISPQLAYIVHQRSKCKVGVLIADGLHLPYKDDTFDFIISIAVIHHIKTEDLRTSFVKELLRILKPGGRLLLSMWAKEQPIKPKWKLIDNTLSDYLIPWKNKVDRFYHLFDKNEVIKLTEINPCIPAIESGDRFCISYECNNWYLEVQKSNMSMF